MEEPVSSSSLFLDRRAGPRVEFHSTARFVPDPTRPLRLSHGLLQNLGPRGASLLSPVVPSRGITFPLWIPVDGNDVLSAMAGVAWIRVEDSLGDSPYWVMSGLRLSFDHPRDLELAERIVGSRVSVGKPGNHDPRSKIGYVF